MWVAVNVLLSTLPFGIVIVLTPLLPLVISSVSVIAKGAPVGMVALN